MSVSLNPSAPLALAAKSGLITVVFVGILIVVLGLTWRLATLPTGSTGETILPWDEVVIGPMMTPLGTRIHKP